MKLVSFDDGKGARAGALTADAAAIVDFAHYLQGEAAAACRSMLGLIEAGAAGLEAARGAVAASRGDAGGLIPLSRARLLAPIPRPPHMRDFVGFEQHLVNAHKATAKLRAAQEPDPEAALKRLEGGAFQVNPVWYRQPVYYKMNPATVVGPEHEVIWPAYSELFDYEIEMACVIGRPGKDIARDGARGHIFGYTVLNDFSARDEIAREITMLMGPSKGKDFDTGIVLGPCIVTADAFDPYAAEMIVRVNGEERSRGNSSTMHWKFEDMIAHASRSETLQAGEVFGSGTVGFGCGLELGRFLAPNDVVELEIAGIGVLRNRVVRPSAK
ncbi:MAG: fumarylacetoacetate hydrolase family protein [Rhodospirillaceae bacterium]|nr:fumarylacetoacetate hydrolase family protein [Rhodospirillaceae bacterium]